MSFEKIKSLISSLFSNLPIIGNPVRCCSSKSSRRKCHCGKGQSNKSWTHCSCCSGRTENVSSRSRCLGNSLQNTSWGLRKASSFDLLNIRTTRFSTFCNPFNHGTTEKNFAATRHRHVHVGVDSKTRSATLIAVSDSINFWRDSEGSVGPTLVISIDNDAVRLNYFGTVKTSVRHRIRIAPERMHAGDDGSYSANDGMFTPSLDLTAESTKNGKVSDEG